MRRSWSFALIPFAAALLACGSDSSQTCSGNDECLQGGIPGVCLDSGGGASYCAFPDESCAAGQRWGVLAGDGLARECVANPANEPDAGPDAAASGDAAPIVLGDLVKHYGGKAAEIPASLGVGPDGSYAITGSFNLGATELGGGTPLMVKGFGDVFVGAYAPEGTHQWSAPFGSGLSDEGQAVGIDSEGALYIAGRYTGSIDFGGVVLIAAAGTDDADLYLAKFAKNGTCQWARSIGGAGYETIGSMVVGADGLFVVGAFESTIDFGMGNVTPVGQSDAYVMKVRLSDGETAWAKAFGSTTAESVGALALRDGSLVVAGRIAGTANPGAGNLTGPAAFIAA